MNRLLSLRPTIRRLEHAELFHLREHCAELAVRIEQLEAENADLKRELDYAQDCAERWRDDALDAINEAGCDVGLTVTGHVVALARQGAPT